MLSFLIALDRNADLVDRHFDSLGKLPMGKYFEQLILFMLQNDERYKVLMNNYQIIQNKQTVGELDLVIRDSRTGAIEHWELCLKYYLQRVPSHRHDVMLGPNAIDNLDRKMKKLTGHQLTLGRHPDILDAINSQSIDSKLFMKGQFFYHLKHSETLPSDSNPDHEKGWWCHLNEVDEMVHSNFKWTTIWKPDWIGPVLRTDDSELISSSQLKTNLSNHFQDENHSVFCVGLRQENGLWVEVTRGFVVNNQWPSPNPTV